MLNYFIIFFSLLGISATFMPWLYYPIVSGIIYGYMGDGVITGVLFFLILIYGIYVIKKKSFNIFISIVAGGLGFLMALLSYSKINSIEAEKLNFGSSNPWISSSTAGFHQGIGVYVFGIAGLCVFITILLALLLQKRHKTSKGIFTHPIITKTIIRYLVGIFLLAGILLTLFLANKNSDARLNAAILKPIISEDISMMGEALINEDYSTFVDFNHPIMIQSMGGRARTIELLQMAMDDQKEMGTRFKAITLNEILDIQKEKKSIQVLFSQSVTMLKEGVEKTEIQKMLAVSEDKGDTWHYINIGGKTKEEIKRFYPELNENLNI